MLFAAPYESCKHWLDLEMIENRKNPYNAVTKWKLVLKFAFIFFIEQFILIIKKQV